MAEPLVHVVYVRTEKVICPHCDADVEGWYGDPRLCQPQACDECGGTIHISPDAEVRLV